MMFVNRAPDIALHSPHVREGNPDIVSQAPSRPIVGLIKQFFELQGRTITVEKRPATAVEKRKKKKSSSKKMDRYGNRYGRPRSPPLYNPARASLPINLAYPENSHLHVIPTSRREVVAPRSTSSNISNAGTVTTTYKIKAEPPSWGSSVREGSRTRRTTLESNLRPNLPTIVTATPRHRPTVIQHSARPASPVKNPYRSSEEEYIAIPASRHSGSHHHKKRYSLTMDNGDLNRAGRDREVERLRPASSGREGAVYTTTRSRPSVYPASVVRHADTVADDYGDDGYGYTNPRDLVQYDLNRTNNNVSANSHRRSRRDSFDGARVSARPNSIGGFGEVVPRSYDARERGPPPSTRGFDRIPPYGESSVRMPVPPPPSSMAPMEPVARPSAFDPIEPVRRSSSRSSNRPTSMYHDREARRGPREDYYEVRDEDLRRRERPVRQHDKYEDPVEQRGFGIRTESDPIRHERSERQDRPAKPETEHKSRDAIATGLSIAGAALGINAVKNAARDDREEKEEREERRRREYDEEPRRRRDEREVEPRETKERRHRDEDIAAPIVPPKTIPSPPRDDDGEPLRRPSSRDDRDNDPERRDRQRRRAEAALSGIAVSSDTSLSDEAAPRDRRRDVRSRESVPAFNPKDTMDLKALKEALNSKEAAAAPKIPPKEPIPRAKTPRESMTRDSREVADIRTTLDHHRSQSQQLERQPRLVSPPRDKLEDKPVKGILRQPRERFPEDPAPIREGVAPLKDAKKDGIPPDARWTKISRKLVNPEALELGKERYEAREDFVIVLRVLSRDEVQGYAEVTQKLRAAREEREDLEALERRRARRERHERHKRERLSGETPRSERPERHHKHRSSRDEHEKDRREDSQSDSTDEENISDGDKVKDIPLKRLEEAPRKRATFEEAVMSGGLGGDGGDGREWGYERGAGGGVGNLRENPYVPGQYTGYVRNPPPPPTSAVVGGGLRG